MLSVFLMIFAFPITPLSFYSPVIPNAEGLKAHRHYFDLRPVLEPSTSTLLRLAELVLTFNCFSFGDRYFKQINGVVMGTKMGLSYANLFVGYIEHLIFNNIPDRNLSFLAAILTTVLVLLLVLVLS